MTKLTSEHTKGPWRVNGINNCDFITSGIDCPDIQFIAQLFDRTDEDFQPFPVKKANAHLIAAAPEMLEVLEDIMNSLGTSDLENVISTIPEIICKAKGEL